jgi:hypothetical protein
MDSSVQTSTYYTDPFDNQTLYLRFFSYCHDFKIKELRSFLENEGDSIDVNCLGFDHRSIPALRCSPHFHRRIFDGQVATFRILMEYGADLTSIDAEVIAILLGRIENQSISLIRLQRENTFALEQQQEQEIVRQKLCLNKIQDMLFTLCDIDYGHQVPMIMEMNTQGETLPSTRFGMYPCLSLSDYSLCFLLQNFGSLASQLALYLHPNNASCTCINGNFIPLLDVVLNCQLGSSAFQHHGLYILFYRCLHWFTNHRYAISEELLTFAVQHGSHWALTYALDLAREEERATHQNPNSTPVDRGWNEVLSTKRVIEISFQACLAFEIPRASSVSASIYCSSDQLLMLRYVEEVMSRYTSTETLTGVNTQKSNLIKTIQLENSNGDSLLMYCCRSFFEMIRTPSGVNEVGLTHHDALNLQLFRTRLKYLIHECECNTEYRNYDGITLLDMLLEEAAQCYHIAMVHRNDFAHISMLPSSEWHSGGTVVSTHFFQNLNESQAIQLSTEALLSYIEIVSSTGADSSCAITSPSEVQVAQRCQFLQAVIAKIIETTFLTNTFNPWLAQYLLLELDQKFHLDNHEIQETVLTQTVKHILDYGGEDMVREQISWLWLCFFVDNFKDRLVYKQDQSSIMSTREILLRLKGRIKLVCMTDKKKENEDTWKLDTLERLLTFVNSKIEESSEGTTKGEKIARLSM